MIALFIGCTDGIPWIGYTINHKGWAFRLAFFGGPLVMEI